MPIKPTKPTTKKRRAGRPSKAIPRENLLRLAISVFAENGYVAASLNAIAAQAGIRKPSLIHRFGNKEKLYLESLSMVMTTLNKLVLHAAQSSGEPADRLDQLNSALVDCFGGAPHSAQLLFREVLDQGPFFQGAGGKLLIQTLQAGVLFLESGKKQGAFDFEDASHVVMSVVGVHLTYFAAPHLSKQVVSEDVFQAGAVEKRRKIVIDQCRRLCGVKTQA